MVKKVTKDTMISELIIKEPGLAEDFFKMGMMCIGCPMSAGETVEQGCIAHGFSEKQTEKFIQMLNKKLEKKSKAKK
jgi:hybrid cluster-associated redox disulfide protein